MIPTWIFNLDIFYVKSLENITLHIKFWGLSSMKEMLIFLWSRFNILTCSLTSTSFDVHPYPHPYMLTHTHIIWYSLTSTLLHAHTHPCHLIFTHIHIVTCLNTSHHLISTHIHIVTYSNTSTSFDIHSHSYAHTHPHRYMLIHITSFDIHSHPHLFM